MPSFNKIIIVGHLGRDPELRHTPQGKAVCDFSIATSDKYGDKETTTWFKVTLWGKIAENAAKYFTKGSPAYVEGRLSQEEWTDRDGKPRTTLAVMGSDLKFISSKSDSPVREQLAASASAPIDFNATDDDIPW